MGVTDRRADRAAAMARAYAEEVNRLAADLNTSEAQSERVFVEERLQETKLELDAAGDLSEFSSKYSAIDVTEQGRCDGAGQQPACRGNSSPLSRN